nr:hypothetical protein [Rickettsia endosymbiont of Ceutorhynchus assimilis]
MNLYCDVCEEVISSYSHNLSHKHKNKCCNELEPEIHILKTAFKNRLISYRLSTKLYPTSVELYLEELKTKIISLITKNISTQPNIKLNMELYGLYILGEMQEIKSFNTCFTVISPNTDLLKVIDEFKRVIVSKSSEFKERDSGWSLVKLLFLEVNINKLKSLK